MLVAVVVYTPVASVSPVGATMFVAEPKTVSNTFCCPTRLPNASVNRTDRVVLLTLSATTWLGLAVHCDRVPLGAPAKNCTEVGKMTLPICAVAVRPWAKVDRNTLEDMPPAAVVVTLCP